MNFLYLKSIFVLATLWFLGWFIPFGIRWLNRQQGPVTLRPEGSVQYLAHIMLIIQHAFAFLLLLGINPFLFLPYTTHPVPLPQPLALISFAGIVLFIYANHIRKRAILEMGSMFEKDVLLKVNHTLIQNGQFQKYRHPIYVGNLLGEFALGMILLSWPICLITVLISFPIWNYRAKTEERLLHHKFGQTYENYRCQVKRWGWF